MEPKLEISRELRRGLNWARNDEAIVPSLARCSAIYRRWLAGRFESYSKGAGDWAPLQPATVRRKSKGPWKQNAERILVESGKLLKTLEGETKLGFGDFPKFGMGDRPTISRAKKMVSIGLGDAVYSNGKRVETIAEIHHYGKGHVPARPIFAEPPEEVLKEMESAVVQMLMKEWGSTYST